MNKNFMQYTGIVDSNPRTQGIESKNILKTDFIVNVENGEFKGYKIKAICLDKLAIWSEVRIEKGQAVELDGFITKNETIDSFRVTKLKIKK